jgi:hypothetical protein
MLARVEVRWIRIALGGVALALCLSLMLEREVARGGPAGVSCADLQAALDAAVDGTVITMAPVQTCHDTYTIKSQSPSTSVTIDGRNSTLEGRTADGTSSLPDRVLAGDSVGHVTITDLRFRNSTAPAGEDGGALKITGNSAVTLVRAYFRGNTAPGAGGGAYIASTSSSPIVVSLSSFGDGTTANRNTASEGGGLAVENGSGGPDIDISETGFSGNVATGGGGGGGLRLSAYGEANQISLTDNGIQSNHASVGGGAAVFGGVVGLERNNFGLNEGDGTASGVVRGAGLYVERKGSANGLFQTDNVFDRNRATHGAVASFGAHGGGEFVLGYGLSSQRDRFIRNSLAAPAGTGEAEGAGLAMESCTVGDSAGITNAVVAGNSVAGEANGAGVYVGCASGSTGLRMEHSTITGNMSSVSPGHPAGLFGGTDDSLYLLESIVAGNSRGGQISGFQTRTIEYSDVCVGGRKVAGRGNICAAPLLDDPKNGDVHERLASPTRDRANPEPYSALKTDFEFDLRSIGHGPDMGADEFSKPILRTLPATNVNVGSATLRGSVNPNTHRVDYAFQYGLSKSYGSTAFGRSVSGTTARGVSARVTGLKADRTYHFRLVLLDGYGKPYAPGGDRTFTTKKDAFAGVVISTKPVTLEGPNRRLAYIPVTCRAPAPGGCGGTLSLGKPPFGQGSFGILTGESELVRVRISDAEAQKVKKNGSVRARATATAHDGAGTVRTTKATVTLRFGP